MEGGVPPAAPPHHVPVPVNLQRWDRIAFLHWAYAAEDVAALLPDGLSVLTYDGVAWVGVTPFVMGLRLPGMSVAPPGCAFPETNVRTYVAGPDGKQGLWFLHMEVAASWFAMGLRGIGLPYVHRSMAVDAQDGRIRYRSDPGGGQGGHDVVVAPGEALRPREGDGRDRFLTARWAAYHRRGPLLLRTPVAHRPWPLRHADAEVAEVDGLLRAAGLPVPRGAPVVHWSEGVDVQVGLPRLVR